MATQITMPKLGLTMKAGTVGKWQKAEGDKIKKGDALVEILTEKITNRIEAKIEGVLLKIVAPKGAMLPVGALIGIIGEQGEDLTEILKAATAAQGAVKTVSGHDPAAKTGIPGERINISPSARKLANESGIDYSRIVGTGPEGRITREDVQKAQEDGVGLEDTFEADDRPFLSVIPYEGARLAIGENMAKSWSSNAMVTHHVKVDMSGILALRKEINEGEPDSSKVSITAILAKAVARALEINPCVNASLIGQEIKIWQDINIGMAIAVPNGLIVPVIRNANTKRLIEVNQEIADLAKRARRNKLILDEMSGATFTITNLGGMGSVDFFTPIINPPEVAILGIGRTVDQPAVVGGQVVVRPLMGLSLTFDHKVVDGAPAAEWLGLLIGLIENPTKIFI